MMTVVLMLQLHNPEAALQTLQQAADLAVAIDYEPLQKQASAKIAALQQPSTPQSLRGMLPSFRLKGWHYVLLGVFAFVLVLVIQWLRQR